MRNDLLLVVVGLAFSACQNISYSGKGNDVPTAGEIRVAVDYGDSFFVNEELEMFHMDYPKSRITPVHLCEVNILRQLEMDSIRFVIMNRDFTPDEKTNLEKLGMKIRSAHIASTSIAVIVSKANPVKKLSQNDLRNVLEGKITDWSSLGGAGNIQTIFDQGCGSNYTYFLTKWFSGKQPGGRIAEKKNPREVIRFVSENKGAIGFVNVNWLSDRTDSACIALAKMVEVVAIENPDKKGYFLPFQSQIRTGEYPFIQKVYMHDLQGYSGLAQGFIAYVASQPGQIILKKSGLIPATDFGRTIQFVEE